MATRLLTGVWPEVGLWAVHPTSSFASRLDALLVLTAGDLAVLAWWAAIFVLIRHRPQWKWALVGPSLMAMLVLVSWIASAMLMPFGHVDLGASDAAKFLAISGVSPWLLAMILCGITGIAAALVTRYFRLPSSTTV